MPTDNPRVTITMSEDQLNKVRDYLYSHKMKNQTQAILSLINKGLETLNATEVLNTQRSFVPQIRAKAKTETDERLELLCENYDLLNDEGREKLVDYSKDLVAGGRYIKDNQAETLEAQA